MLIRTYKLDVFTPPCEPGAERFAAIARLEDDISEVLPYLNATLRGAVYHPAAKALTWKKAGHNTILPSTPLRSPYPTPRTAKEQKGKSMG